MPKKTAAPKSLEANRRNSKESTGPRTEAGKARASRNALKYGLAARALPFDSDEERNFQQLVDQLIEGYEPRSRQEELLVLEVATQFHRSCRCSRLVESAVRARNVGSAAALDLFVNSAYELMDPRRSAFESGMNLPFMRTHHCSEFELRNEIVKDSRKQGDATSTARSVNRASVVKFASLLETFLRYEAQIKRALHRDIDQLERLQGRGSGQE